MADTELLQTGLKYYQQGNLDAAEKHFRQIVSRDSNNVHGLNLLGMVCVNTGRHEEAAELITRALELKPDDAQAHGNLGLAYQRMGKLESAERHFRQSIDLDPDKPVMWNSLGNVLRDKGQAAEAVKAYESTLRANGNYPECWANLSKALVDLGEYERAFQAVSRALQINPTVADFHNQIAEVYRKGSKFEQAIRAYKKSLELDPKLYESMLGLATVYRESEDAEAALAVLERLIDMEPRHARAYTVLGILKEQLGEPGVAADCFRKSIELAPGVVSPHWHLSQIKGRKSTADEILAMERLQEIPGLSRQDKTHLHFALGAAYDQHDQTDKAFDAWRIANQIKAERFPFDPEKRKQHSDATLEHSEVLAAKLAKVPVEDGRQIVFVIGMPRSGTSLTDQILSSHSSVSSLGEVGHADEMMNQVRKLTGQVYPMGLSQLAESDVRLLRDDYLRKVDAKHADSLVLLDKTPMNFQYLGLLAEVFPCSKFIHCRRDPVDNCFSIFKLSFADDQDYAHDLTALGQQYSLYAEMMDTWKEMYADRILDVHYEDTVADIEAQCGRLVAFLGLSFEPDMLEFYLSERLVRTPSASQVRQPIYKSSVEAWRRYEKHLQPLILALDAQKKEVSTDE